MDMASISTTARVKVIVLLHEGVPSTSKLWSFRLELLQSIPWKGFEHRLCHFFTP